MLRHKSAAHAINAGRSALFPVKALIGQILFKRGRIHLQQIRADGHVVLLITEGDHLFSEIHAVFVNEQIHQPTREGIAHREELGRIFRIDDSGTIAHQTAQHGVDQPAHLLSAEAARQLHCIVAGGGFRNSIHKNELIHAHTKDIQRHIVAAGTLHVLGKDVIQTDAVFQHAIEQFRHQPSIQRGKARGSDAARQSKPCVSIGNLHIHQRFQCGDAGRRRAFGAPRLFAPAGVCCFGVGLARRAALIRIRHDSLPIPRLPAWACRAGNRVRSFVSSRGPAFPRSAKHPLRRPQTALLCHSL